MAVQMTKVDSAVVVVVVVVVTGPSVENIAVNVIAMSCRDLVVIIVRIGLCKSTQNWSPVYLRGVICRRRGPLVVVVI